ncbi:hypothetical protein predicted by Glimmer/Critica [Acetobacter ghanensis]|uniref:Uncharacterized protein n=1 Tax=Acetobacter ghanensis TaxID=431306 RepID=A0A0U5F221_9PROT|nr:hypothetical protein predicted by Glimmer/Critica [Acetobacter ghanensis]
MPSAFHVEWLQPAGSSAGLLAGAPSALNWLRDDQGRCWVSERDMGTADNAHFLRMWSFAGEFMKCV